MTVETRVHSESDFAKLIERLPPKKAAGEPYVWLTSLGLSVGLAMILCLLGVIAANGVAVFWPKNVFQLETPAGPVLAEIAEQRERRGREEWQVYTANREVYGLSFRFIDRKDIGPVTRPADTMVIERLEYGDAIGFPVALELEKDGRISAEEAPFDKVLAGEVKIVRERWREIRRIEKGQIGAINAEMEGLRLREKGLLKRDASSSKIADIRTRMDRLNKSFDALAVRARGLRSEQTRNRLIYRLAGGEEKKIATGQIVHFYHPNRLSLAGRAALFADNIRRFLTEDPREANTEGGIFPAIFGTFVMTVIMSLVVMPFGVVAAIYLHEYAKHGFFLRCVRIAINNLAGVPSIVFGVFGLGFFVYTLGGSIDALFYQDALPTPTFGTGGIFWASLTLALMTVPVVIVATEEAIAAVPRGMREGSLACGASKWQTIQRIVLPASAPGIITGLILAMARGAGEVAPLMIVGVVKLAPSLPLDGVFPFAHLDRKFMHLGFHIYDLGFQSPDSDAAKPMVFATTLALIVLVVLLNITAIRTRQSLRKKYRVGAF